MTASMTRVGVSISDMGGKSTNLRMLAVLVLMAQMGSWVPAQCMELSVFDAIFTRMGASDNINKGIASFDLFQLLDSSRCHTST